MISFTIGRIQVSLDFTFFAVLGTVCAFDSGGYGVLYLLACLCHETAHIAVMAIKGQAPKRIIFSGGGICIKQADDVCFSVLAAGPAVNFILFFVFAFALEQNSIYKLIFAAANLCVGLFNLLPMGDLDGRRLAEKLLSKLLPYSKAQRFIGVLQGFTFVCWGAVVLFLLWNGSVNLTAVFVMVYILLIDCFLENK